MKTKLSVAVLFSFFAFSNAWAGAQFREATWSGDLKLGDKVYSCKGEREVHSQSIWGTGAGMGSTNYICINNITAQDKNQALWIIKVYGSYDSNFGESKEEASTTYYENCKFIEDEGWDCEKEEILSQTENLVGELELQNDKELEGASDNPRSWIKGKNEEEKAEGNDECGCDGEIFSRHFCENFTVEEFRETMKTYGKEDIDGDLDGLGLTQLMCAAFNKDLTMAEELIKAGANVNAENSVGKTVLMLAAKVNPNPEMIKLLLKNGANINAVSDDINWSALTWAIGDNSNQEVAKTILEAKPDPNLGFSPLREAVYEQYPLDFIEKLAKAGANAKNKGEGLISAVGRYKNEPYGLDLIKLLIDVGADVNYNSGHYTPLIEASSRGGLNEMDFLIKAGADVNQQASETGETALMNAKNPQFVKALIEAGADVNLRNKEGKTALMKYLFDEYKQRSNHLEMVKLILAKNPDVNIQSNYGWTALMYALRNEKELDENMMREVAKLIIAKKPKLYLSNNDGWTALHLAARYQNPELVDLIIKAGADLEQKTNDGWTVLHLAARNQNPELVDSIIKAGADLEQKTNDGGTSLSLAVYNENYSTEIVKLLLNAGADPKVKSNEGKTALDYAKEEGKTEIVELLEKALKPKTNANEPKELLEIRKIYEETKDLIPNRDKLSTNYSGKVLVEGTPIEVKTSHSAYFAKNRGNNNQRIIFIESSFKGANGLNSATEYLFDKGNLIFAYKKSTSQTATNETRCYYQNQKIIYRNGEFASTEECLRLSKKGEELKKSILTMQN